ncbi:calcium-binding protein [Porticoccus sp. GXU_MW_L64]
MRNPNFYIENSGLYIDESGRQTVIGTARIEDDVVENPGQFKRVIFGNNDVDDLVGGIHADRIYGLGGNDTIAGESGRDYIEGGKGDDTIEGGKDRDELLGGDGQDTFIYNNGDGVDTILDGDTGGDRIEINSTDISTLNFKSVDGSNVYKDEDSDISIIVDEDASTAVINVKSQNDIGQIRLTQFVDGDYGITLGSEDKVRDPGPPTSDSIPFDFININRFGSYEWTPHKFWYYGTILDRKVWHRDQRVSVQIDYSYFDDSNRERYPTATNILVSYMVTGGTANDYMIGSSNVANQGDQFYGLEGDDYIEL